MTVPAEELIAAMVQEPMIELLDPKFDGPVKSIYCYLPPDQSRPSRDFLNSLETKVQATYAKQFEKTCGGHNLRGERWHGWTEDDGKGCKGIYEYKDNASQTRLLHVVEGPLHVLLFGFGGKKENKIKPGHVLRALAMKAEYEARRDMIEKRLSAKGKK